MDYFLLLDNKETYHRTCLFCSVNLLDSIQPERVDIDDAVMKSVPRLLNFQTQSDLSNEVSRTSACCSCLKSVEEGHHMLRQLDEIQKKIDDISALLKIKIMEGCVRQSSNANAQYYPVVRKLTDNVRAKMASYLNLGVLVSTLVTPVNKCNSNESASTVSDSEDTTNNGEHNMTNWSDMELNQDETTEAMPTDHRDDPENAVTKIEISSTYGDKDNNLAPSKKFSTKEIAVLIRLYNERRNELNAKGCSLRQRAKIWKEIASQLSQVSNCSREYWQCRTKIGKLKAAGGLCFSNDESAVSNSYLAVLTPTRQVDDDECGDGLHFEDVQPDHDDNEVEQGDRRTCKRRNPNFEEDEVTILVSEYGKYLKRFKTKPAKNIRKAAFAKIAKTVSNQSVSKYQRSGEQCWRKIGNLKQLGFLKEMMMMNHHSTFEFDVQSAPEDEESAQDPLSSRSTEDNMESDIFGEHLSTALAESDEVSSLVTDLPADDAKVQMQGDGECVLLPTRNPNFEPDEISILLTEYKKNASVLSDPSHTKKMIVWEQISKAVSTRSASKIRRTTDQCRNKMKNLRRSGLIQDLLDSCSVPEECTNPTASNSADAGSSTPNLLAANEEKCLGYDVTDVPSIERNHKSVARRIRFPNFEPDELSILVKEYYKNLQLLSTADHSKKSAVWEKISNAVFAGSSSKIPRTVEQYRHKITNLLYSGGIQALVNDDSSLEDTRDSQTDFTSDLQEQGDMDNYFEKSEVKVSNTDSSTNDEVEGRRRIPNFDDDEIKILAREYKKWFSGGCKGVDKSKRNMLWERIADAVSTRSNSKFPRTAEQCKTKIQNLKYSGTLDEFSNMETPLDGPSTSDKQKAGRATYEVAVPNGSFVLKRFELQLPRCDEVAAKPVSRRLQMVQRREKRKLTLTQKLMKKQVQTKPPKKPGNFKCSICPLKFTNRTILFRHQTLAHGQATRPNYSCPHSDSEQDGCHERFSSTILLERHLKLSHNAEFAYFCDEDDSCGKGFYTTVALEYHKNLNHVTCVRNSRCDICNKSFISERTFMGHMRKHTGKQFLCEICSSTFNTDLSLETHRSKVHGKTFPCPECNLPCINRNALKDHLLLKHDEHGRRRILKYVCPVSECSLRFRTPSVLKRHTQKFHSGDEMNFQCDQCPTSFKCQYSLNAHLRIHAASTKRKCPYCSQTMANSHSLKNHIKVLHEKASDVRCEACGEGFPIRKYYLRHLNQCTGSTKSDQPSNQRFSES